MTHQHDNPEDPLLDPMTEDLAKRVAEAAGGLVETAPDFESPEVDPGEWHDFFSYIEEVYHSESPERDVGTAILEAAEPEPVPEAEEPEDEAAPADLRDPSRPSLTRLVPVEHRNSAGRWWRHTVVEIALLFGIAVALEVSLRGGRVGALGWQPHPYWIVILLMAAGRGAVAGMIAAAVGGTLYAFGVQQLNGIGALELLSLEYLQEPVLFLAVAFLVGEFRDELGARYHKLRKRYESLRSATNDLRQENQLLAAANFELKRRFVDHDAQFSNLVSAAVMIESASASDIYDLALFMVVEHCGASMASVLIVMDTGSVDLAREVGWEEDETRRRLEEADHSSQVRRAIKEAVRVNGLSSGESPPTSGPLIVAPIIDTSGMVAALLCLDEIPASRFNDSTVSTFFGIAEWISASLRRLSRGQKPFDFRSTIAEMSSPAAWVGSARELGARLCIEDARCSRLGVVSSLLAIQATHIHPSDPQALAGLDDYLREDLSTGLRVSDGLYHFGYPGCYVAVLAGTDAAGTEVVRQRIQRRLAFLDHPEFGTVDITAFSPGDEAPDLERLLQHVAEHFRAHSPMPLDPTCPVAVPRGTVTGGFEEFIRRLRIEISLAQRYDKDLHVLDLQTPTGDSDTGPMVARHLEHIAENWLRGTDGIYVVGANRCAVILPGSSPENADRILVRLTDSLRSRIPSSRIPTLQPAVHGLGGSAFRSLLDAFVGERPGTSEAP